MYNKLCQKVQINTKVSFESTQNYYNMIKSQKQLKIKNHAPEKKINQISSQRQIV